MLKIVKYARINDLIRIGDYYYPVKVYNQALKTLPKDSTWQINEAGTLKLNWASGEIGIYAVTDIDTSLGLKNVLYRRDKKSFLGEIVGEREYFGGELGVFQ